MAQPSSCLLIRWSILYTNYVQLSFRLKTLENNIVRMLSTKTEH